MATKRQQEGGGSEEEGEGRGVTCSRTQWDALAARLTMEAATKVEGESGDDDSRMLWGQGRQHQIERDEAKPMTATAQTEGHRR